MIKKLTLLAAGVLAGIFLNPLFSQNPCLQMACPAAVQNICDYSDNDPALWNYIAWWDPATESNNLADAEVDLSLQVTETCAAAFSVDFDLLLDLDGNGAVESRINSTMLSTITAGFVPYNNYPDPDKLEWRVFDLRNVAPEANYRFALQKTTTGNTHSYRIAWNTGQTPDNYLPLKLPYGQHQIVWSVTDDAGNQETCSAAFKIADCKKPVFVCSDGFVANMMPSGMVTLFATDFLQYLEDNYTPTNKIQLAVRKSGTGSGFPLDSAGNPQTRIIFNCDELETNYIDLWARDAAGNADYCSSYIFLQDTVGNCSTIGADDTVTCCLSYCGNSFPLDAQFGLTGNHPALPPSTLFDDPPLPVNPDGCRKYHIQGIPFLGDYAFTPSKDSDPLNGFSTYDLVLIEQYLLGQPTLDSPYKLIAADANNSRSVTSTDIAVLRKLLLGFYQELPNNTSWRFIPSDFDFPDPLNPFATVFPETVNFFDATDIIGFEGVKVGDVSCNATPSGQLPQRESLGLTKGFCLKIANRNLGPGSTLVLPVTAGNAADLLGYQFDLKIAGPLQVTGIIPGPGQTADNFAILGNEVLCSWSSGTPVNFQVGDTLFYLELSTMNHTNTKSTLSFNQQRMYAEAYTPQEKYRALTLCFSGTTTPGDPGPKMMVMQPNPVVDRASVTVPETWSGAAQWAVFDLSGRVLLQGSGMIDAGQVLELPLETLPAGVYVYRVQVGEAFESGKLVKM